MEDSQMPAMGRPTYLLIRAFGYCCLILSLLDNLVLAIPFKFTDAVWELSLYGQLIERIPLLLLAFPLIFMGEYSARMTWERIITKIVAWIAIIAAVLLLLGVPLAIVNTVRVQNIRHSEIIAKVAQQNGPIQEVANRLSKANTDNEIRNILQAMNAQANISDRINLQEAKQTLLAEIEKSVLKNQTEADVLKRRATISLWKDGAKWAIAGLFSGLFLVYVWLQSKWTRVGISY
jgi:hypothetical protein